MPTKQENEEWEAMKVQALWDARLAESAPVRRALPAVRPAVAERVAAVLDRFAGAFARLA